jgi:hypothetical protein
MKSERCSTLFPAVTGIVILMVNSLLFWGLLRVWPVQRPDASSVDPFVYMPWGTNFCPIEIRYLLITAVAGAIGSSIHLTTSFVYHAGRGQLVASWVWWYALRPFIGSYLALIVYFTLRAGFLNGTGESITGSLSPYGIAAVAGLSGLFSKHATQKLREVFESLFKTGGPSPEGEDPHPSPEDC